MTRLPGGRGPGTRTVAGSIEIVSLRDRPDLVDVTARWRWETWFAARDISWEATREAERQAALATGPIPQILVLLADGTPAGMAALVPHDLDERPDLAPWLAGVFVAPDRRRSGFASQLVQAIEAKAAEAGSATLWLYTRTADRLYARLGWTTAETITLKGRAHALMRRDL